MIVVSPEEYYLSFLVCQYVLLSNTELTYVHLGERCRGEMQVKNGHMAVPI